MIRTPDGYLVHLDWNTDRAGAQSVPHFGHASGAIVQIIRSRSGKRWYQAVVPRASVSLVAGRAIDRALDVIAGTKMRGAFVPCVTRQALVALNLHTEVTHAAEDHGCFALALHVLGAGSVTRFAGLPGPLAFFFVLIVNRHAKARPLIVVALHASLRADVVAGRRAVLCIGSRSGGRCEHECEHSYGSSGEDAA